MQKKKGWTMLKLVDYFKVNGYNKQGSYMIK